MSIIGEKTPGSSKPGLITHELDFVEYINYMNQLSTREKR